METAGTYRITRAGQMTVPNVVREKWALKEGTPMDVYYTDDIMVIRKKPTPLDLFDKVSAETERRFKERGTTRMDVADAIKAARNEMRD
jgi:AbrB family looped-hinge helix DNA binding protein